MSKKEAWCWSCACWHPEGNNTHSAFKCRSKYRTLWLTVSRTNGYFSPEVAAVLSVQTRKKACTLDKVKTDPRSMCFTMSTNLEKVSYEEAKKDVV